MYPIPDHLLIIVRGVLDGGFRYHDDPVWSLLVLYVPLVRIAYRMGRYGAMAVDIWVSPPGH